MKGKKGFRNNAFAKYEITSHNETYHVSWWERMTYNFDVWISRKVGAVGMGLVFWMLIQVSVGGLIFGLVDHGTSYSTW